jgi:polyisoprenoid-binding protein YceI
MAVKKGTRTTLAIVAGAVLVIGAGGAVVGPRIYVALASHEAQAPPALSSKPAGSGTAVRNLSGEWVVAPGSYAGYRVKEDLEGQHLQVTGRTSKVSGSFEATGLTLSSATVTVEVGAIATAEPARDAYFRDVALDVAKFPTATFTLTRPVTVKPAVPGTPQTFTVDGRLALHGVTRDVRVRLEAEAEGAGGRIAGRIPITFSDYGVTAPSLGFVTVEKAGDIEFLLDVVRR